MFQMIGALPKPTAIFTYNGSLFKTLCWLSDFEDIWETLLPKISDQL